MNTEPTPTSTIHVRPARREDFHPIAALIDEQNKTPATQCLISGEGAESIYQQMVAYDEVGEICFAVATCDDCLAGVLGCEFDLALGRGWLWGRSSWPGTTGSTWPPRCSKSCCISCPPPSAGWIASCTSTISAAAGST